MKAVNTFYSINKLPPEKGFLVLGLSMSKLDYGGQNAQNCYEAARSFLPKVLKPAVGFHSIYSDFLYLYNDANKASVLKDSYMHQIIRHKSGFMKRIQSDPLEFQVPSAFSFSTWNQMYLSGNHFYESFKKLQLIYKEDKDFQKYVKEDCLSYGRELDDNQIKFFLEESLMVYFITHNQLSIENKFIMDGQKWILFCYFGNPLKTMVYLYQLDPFKLTWESNPYARTWYNLSTKELIEYDRVDLETWDNSDSEKQD